MYEPVTEESNTQVSSVVECAVRGIRGFTGATPESAWQTLWTIFYQTRRHDSRFNTEWRTDTVVAIARGIVEDRSFSVLPILADAIQDAGCYDEPLLGDLRHGHESRILSSWILWNLLGYDKKPPKT